MENGCEEILQDLDDKELVKIVTKNPDGDTAWSYVQDMIKQDLLEMRADVKGKLVFELTEKGMARLYDYCDLDFYNSEYTGIHFISEIMDSYKDSENRMTPEDLWCFFGEFMDLDVFNGEIRVQITQHGSQLAESNL
ncbi:hypothetical protein JKG47_20350 [Acidithiobacillus sp. MC6.1]|nr:hypothetical protein [Acidithiobacillus sp. MC6.1]